MWLCPFWGCWNSGLSQRWLFSWVSTGQGAFPPMCSWSVLPPVGSSHSPAKVEKVELIYLQDQIKIKLSPFFLFILRGVNTPSQLCGQGYAGAPVKGAGK